jgi:hypothetical protein
MSANDSTATVGETPDTPKLFSHYDPTLMAAVNMACSTIKQRPACFVYHTMLHLCTTARRDIESQQGNVISTVRDKPRQNLHNNTSKWMTHIFVITTEQ